MSSSQLIDALAVL